MIPSPCWASSMAWAEVSVEGCVHDFEEAAGPVSSARRDPMGHQQLARVEAAPEHGLDIGLAEQVPDRSLLSAVLGPLVLVDSDRFPKRALGVSSSIDVSKGSDVERISEGENRRVWL